MVADIRLLQGKLIGDPELGNKNVSKLIEELALEILSEEELAVASAVSSTMSSTMSSTQEGNS